MNGLRYLSKIIMVIPDGEKTSLSWQKYVENITKIMNM